METVVQRMATTGPQTLDATYPEDSKHVHSTRTTALNGNYNAETHDIPALRHKVDRHIVPIMFLCYLMNFIDKVALNVCTGVFNFYYYTILT